MAGLNRNSIEVKLSSSLMEGVKLPVREPSPEKDSRVGVCESSE